jgi:hypothetical protein
MYPLRLVHTSFSPATRHTLHEFPSLGTCLTLVLFITSCWASVATSHEWLALLMQDRGEGPANLGYEKVLAGLQLVSTLAAAQLFDALLAWRKASLKLTSTQQSDQITILRKRVRSLFCQGYKQGFHRVATQCIAGSHCCISAYLITIMRTLPAPCRSTIIKPYSLETPAKVDAQRLLARLVQ